MVPGSNEIREKSVLEGRFLEPDSRKDSAFEGPVAGVLERLREVLRAGLGALSLPVYR